MRRSNSLLNNLSDSMNQSAPGMHPPYAQPNPGSASQATPYDTHQHPGAYGQPASAFPGQPMASGGHPQTQHPHGFPHAAHPPAAPYPPSQAVHPQGTNASEIANVKATLDGLANRLNSVAQMQPASGTPQGASAQPAAADPFTGSEIVADLKNLSSAIIELQSAVSAMQSQPSPLAEIAELKAGIDQIRDDISTRVIAGLDTRIDPSAYAEAVEKSHLDILGQIREIQTAVETGSNGSQMIADTLHARQNDLVSRLDDITAALVNMDRQEDREEVIAIRENLTRLDASISEFLQKDGQEAIASELGERLDEITRGILALSAPDTSIDNLERIEARMVDLSRDLKELTDSPKETTQGFDEKSLEPYFAQTLSSLKAFEDRLGGIESDNKTADGIERLAADIAGLSDRVGNLSVASTSSGDGSSVVSDPALLERLDELVTRVEGLQTENRQLEDTTGHLGSIEEQVSEVSRQLDGMITNSQENQQVLERLDAIGERVEFLCSAEPSAPSQAFVEDLQSRISHIATSLDSRTGDSEEFPRLNQRLEGIEKQLGANRDIGIEVAAGAAEEAVRKVIAEMPQTGSAIDREIFEELLQDVKKLGESGRVSSSGEEAEISSLRQALEGISNRLATIEDGLEQMGSRAFVAQGSVEIPVAQTVAQVAQPVASHAVASSSQEQKDMERFAEDTLAEQHGKSSAGELLVKAARAAEQERQLAKKGYEENYAKAHETPNSRDFDAGLTATVEEDEVEPTVAMPEVEAPSLGSSELPEIQPLDMTEKGDEDVAIEPGSGGPDLAALVRQANNQRKALSDKGEASGGTDFLAAARRAAQAAALEASELEKQEDEESKSGGFLDSLPNLFARNKKTIAIAAAAALLVALAVPVISKFTSGTPQPEVASSTVGSSDETLNQSSGTTDTLAANDPVTPAPEGTWDTTSQPIPDASPTEPVIEVSELNSPDLPVTPASINLDLTKADFAPQALRDAVQQGDPLAYFEIARRYTNGIGVSKNLDEAARWYEKSATLGVVPAQYVIGNFHEKGIGGPVDRTMARAWYEQAALSGHVISMHNLGVMSASPDPQTGESNFDEAVKWFKKAAEFGVRDSQVNLGIFLAKGSGGEVDLIESFKWFSLASQSGDPDATDKRNFVANALRPDQLEQAKILVDNWVEQKPDPKANEVSVPESWKGDARTAVLDDRNSIAKVQTLLTKVGFNVGPADGVLGKRTRKAISDFRSRAGLPVNDRVDKELLDALIAVAI